MSWIRNTGAIGPPTLMADYKPSFKHKMYGYAHRVSSQAPRSSLITTSVLQDIKGTVSKDDIFLPYKLKSVPVTLFKELVAAFRKPPVTVKLAPEPDCDSENCSVNRL
jgi:hypothetical protein